MQWYKLFDYSMMQLDNMMNAGKMCNPIQKGTAIQWCNAMMQEQDDVEFEMSTMWVEEGKTQYIPLLSRHYFTELVIL